MSDPAKTNLGSLLLMARKIDKETLDNALTIQASTGKHLGSVIVEMGKLTPKDLVAMLQRQAALRGEEVDSLELAKQVHRMLSLKHFRVMQAAAEVREIAGKLGA